MINVFKPIQTERLLLRKLKLEDAGDFFEYRSKPEIQEFQAFKHNSVQETKEFLFEIENSINVPNTWYQMAVCLRETNQLIGDIGIHFTQDDLQTEIGYTLSPEFQHKGYAKEGVKAVMDFLFMSLLKHRVFASVDPLNGPSIRLLESLGMRKEAHFVKSYRLSDGWGDDAIYAILEEEWFNGKI